MERFGGSRADLGGGNRIDRDDCIFGFRREQGDVPGEAEAGAAAAEEEEAAVVRAAATASSLSYQRAPSACK